MLAATMTTAGAETDDFERKLRSERRWALISRPGLAGPAAFAGAVVAAILLFAEQHGVLVGGWSVAALFVVIGLLGRQLDGRETFRLAIQSLTDKRYGKVGAAEAASQASLRRSIEIVADIAIRIADYQEKRGKHGRLRDVLAAAGALLYLHYETVFQSHSALLSVARTRAVGEEAQQALEALLRLLEALKEQEPWQATETVTQMAQEAEMTVLRLHAKAQDDELEAPPDASYEAEEAPELRALRVRLEEGFARAGSEDGLRVVKQLAEEYQRFLPILAEAKESDPMGIAEVPALAQETYNRGLQELGRILTLARGSDSAKEQRLRASVEKLGQEIAAADASLKAGLVLSKEETDLLQSKKTAADRDRGLLLESQNSRILLEQKLLDAGHFETDLSLARMGYIKYRAGDTSSDISVVTERLKKAIQRALEVQEEMKRMGL